jgi:N-carbamoyl-L-amino-acid hydrolase
VMTGSHLDSQPTGGKFDGIYGVLAALEAVQAMREAGVTPRRSIEIVSWMNEEGSRFAPGMMGSAAFAGSMTLAEMLPVRDAAGTSVADSLAAMRAAFPAVPELPLGRPVAAYVEAHIEQGPILEREGFSVGVVTGIQGKRTFRVTVRGAEAHAGTSMRKERKDALLAATAMIQALAAALHDAEDVVKFTVGRLVVKPNAPSVVAGEAVFSIDLRHPVSDVLRALGDRVPSLCAAHAGPCAVDVAELVTAMSLEFPEIVRTVIRDRAAALGIRTMDLLSAAGHDARYLHEICPSGMIFVPCRDGISHNEAESATPQDLRDGARVLAETLLVLSQR